MTGLIKKAPRNLVVKILIGLIAVTSLMLFGMSIEQLLIRSVNGLDSLNRPVMTDFISFWSAARMAMQGHAADAYMPPLLTAFGSKALPGFTASLPWFYPPFSILLLLPFGLPPYAVSAGLFQALTFGAYIWLIRHQLTPFALLMVISASGVSYNFLQGQGGFLITGLLVGGIMCLKTRPVLAGILFGCLFYKPHFAILTPLLLLAGGHTRALKAQIITVIVLVVSSALILGIETWIAFFKSIPFVRALLEMGMTRWPKMGSTFVMARMVGIPVAGAWVLHALVAIGAAFMAMRVWRRSRDLGLRIAVSIVAVFLIAPFQYDYDHALLVPALLYWGHSTRRWPEWILIVTIWIGDFPAAAFAKHLHFQIFPLLLMGALYALTRPARIKQGLPRFGTTQTA